LESIQNYKKEVRKKIAINEGNTSVKGKVAAQSISLGQKSLKVFLWFVLFTFLWAHAHM
jgi:hypothetical protein